MNPLANLEKSLTIFTKKERMIAEAILKDPVIVIQYPAEAIAKEVSSSKSAYIRMCQKMGYEGYSDFRFSISRHLVSTGSKDNVDNPMQAILQSYSEHILNIASTVKKEDVHALATSIIQAKRIKIFGLNRTGLSAKQLRMRLTKLGIDAEAINDTVIMRDLSTMLDHNDLCIVFSIKAMPDYLPILKEMKVHHTKTTLLTMTPKTPLRKEVDTLIQFPFISRSSVDSFLDDQAIFFVFIEILLNEIARLVSEK